MSGNVECEWKFVSCMKLSFKTAFDEMFKVLQKVGMEERLNN